MELRPLRGLAPLVGCADAGHSRGRTGRISPGPFQADRRSGGQADSRSKQRAVPAFCPASTAYLVLREVAFLPLPPPTPLPLDPVLRLCLVDRLPLHVGRIVLPATGERDDVIDDVTGPAVRMARLPHEALPRRAAPDGSAVAVVRLIAGMGVSGSMGFTDMTRAAGADAGTAAGDALVALVLGLERYRQKQEDRNGQPRTPEIEERISRGHLIAGSSHDRGPGSPGQTSDSRGHAAIAGRRRRAPHLIGQPAFERGGGNLTSPEAIGRGSRRRADRGQVAHVPPAVPAHEEVHADRQAAGQRGLADLLACPEPGQFVTREHLEALQPLSTPGIHAGGSEPGREVLPRYWMIPRESYRSPRW